MQSNRGAALILSLLILSFLAVLGGALLTTTAIDIRIGDNYRTNLLALHLAESGIEEARERLRVSGLPVVGSAPFMVGTGYQVWLRNGVGDSVVLVSTAVVGNARRTVESAVRKGGFPENPRPGSLPQLAVSISANAMEAWNAPVRITDFGSPTDFRVGVANSDCTIGSGAGYGLLLVRGKLRISGMVAWTGLILVIGEGRVERDPGSGGSVVGGVVVARTVDATSGSADLSGVDVHYDPAAWTRANASFPWAVISRREY